jgi:hypothetical protein
MDEQASAVVERETGIPEKGEVRCWERFRSWPNMSEGRRNVAPKSDQTCHLRAFG